MVCFGLSPLEWWSITSHTVIAFLFHLENPTGFESGSHWLLAVEWERFTEKPLFHPKWQKTFNKLFLKNKGSQPKLDQNIFNESHSKESPTKYRVFLLCEPYPGGPSGYPQQVVRAIPYDPVLVCISSTITVMPVQSFWHSLMKKYRKKVVFFPNVCSWLVLGFFLGEGDVFCFFFFKQEWRFFSLGHFLCSCCTHKVSG